MREIYAYKKDAGKYLPMNTHESINFLPSLFIWFSLFKREEMNFISPKDDGLAFVVLKILRYL